MADFLAPLFLVKRQTGTGSAGAFEGAAAELSSLRGVSEPFSLAAFNEALSQIHPSRGAGAGLLVDRVAACFPLDLVSLRIVVGLRGRTGAQGLWFLMAGDWLAELKLRSR